MTTFTAPRLRMPEAGTAFAISEPATTARPTTREINRMLMYEDLARARMREAEQQAARRRLARQVADARRWRRLERWAHRHARAAEARLQQ